MKKMSGMAGKNGKLTKSERNKIRYYTRKEQGICQWCNNKTEQGHVLCPECLIKNREETRTFHEYLRSQHICPGCKKEKLFGTERYCPECKAKTYVYRPMTEELKSKSREYQRMRYHKRKEQGLCVQCGKENHNGKIRCDYCNSINKSKRLTPISKKEIYKEKGLCSNCGKPRYENFKLCKECYDRIIKAGSYDRKKIKKWSKYEVV